MSNRLPETELANWSFLPVEQKRLALVAFDGPKIIKGSYEPFRRVFPDVVNQQFPLFGDELSESNWIDLERRLVSECKGNAYLVDMNKKILAATYAFAIENGISATSIDVTPLRFSGGITYSFGLTILIRYRDRASIIFLDLRRSNGINPNGRGFVFSAMHHRFREAYPDLGGAGLEIWRYKNNDCRTLISQSADQIMYSHAELSADVKETYEIWSHIKRSGEEKNRASAGGPGPLFQLR